MLLSIKVHSVFFPTLSTDMCPLEHFFLRQTSTLFQFLNVFFTILLNSAADKYITPPVDICAANFMLATQLQSRC